MNIKTCMLIDVVYDLFNREIYAKYNNLVFVINSVYYEYDFC